MKEKLIGILIGTVFTLTLLHLQAAHASIPAQGKPGEYEVTARSNKTVIDPGGEIIFEVYITGYGNIDEAKLQIYWSEDVYSFKPGNKGEEVNNEEESDKYSTILIQTKRVGKDQALHDHLYVNELGITHTFDAKEEHSIFSPQEEAGLQISSEKYKNPCPVQLDLRAKSDTEPGNYYVGFYFTYFNGDTWKVSKYISQFKVRSRLEKYSSWEWPWWVALVAAGLTIIAGIIAIIKFFPWVVSCCESTKKGGQEPCRRTKELKP